jgi:hypothetical protein
MRVVKVFNGANFRYELKCPACRGESTPLTIGDLIKFAAFIAASGVVVFLQHEVEHGYSLTLAVLNYVSGLTLASIIGSLFIGVVVVLAVLWIIWRPKPTDVPPCSW